MAAGLRGHGGSLRLSSDFGLNLEQIENISKEPGVEDSGTAANSGSGAKADALRRKEEGACKLVLRHVDPLGAKTAPERMGRPARRTGYPAANARLIFFIAPPPIGGRGA